MKRIFKFLIPVLFVIPIIIGAFGYADEGYGVGDSLYAAFCLYFVNPLFDDTNLLVDISKWTAPLATASGIFLAVKDFIQRIKNHFISLNSDATIVYAMPDDEDARELAKNCTHGILSEISEGEAKVYPDAMNHILLFPDDAGNMEFFELHKEDFSDSNVYIKLNETSSFLLKNSPIHFFNTNELIASDFWKNEGLVGLYKEHLLAKSGSPFSINIAIIGFSEMGQSLLEQGILLNLFSLDQQINYHIFGDHIIYNNIHGQINLMNSDSIIFHDNDWSQNMDLLKSCQRIIIVEAESNILQAVFTTCFSSQVYIYSPNGISYSSVFSFPYLKEFGDLSNVYTVDCIMNEERLALAKKLNYKYSCLYGGASESGTPQEIEKASNNEWYSLNGFTKVSNLASTDYHHIRKEVLDERESLGIGTDYDELGRIEHIRWCRFHFLNHWTYGVPANGKAKDAEKRIHVCLVPYDDLSDLDKSKDIEAVKLLMSTL